MTVKKLFSLLTLAAFVFVLGCNEPAKTTGGKSTTPPAVKTGGSDKGDAGKTAPDKVDTKAPEKTDEKPATPPAEKKDENPAEKKDEKPAEKKDGK